MKTHPAPEEWMSFLYGEETPQRHAELDAHLRDCAECRQRVESWRGAMTALDTWQLPAARPARTASTAWRWAAAAAVVLALGFGLGRATNPTSGELRAMQSSLRAEVETQFAAMHVEFNQALQQQRTELADALHGAATEAAGQEARQLIARFAQVLDEQREKDHEVYLAAFKRLEERRATDYSTLRKDLNTLAVNADDGISRTQEQLLQLASMTQAVPPGH